MEKAKEFIVKLTTSEEADSVSRLTFPPHRPYTESSFYEFFTTRDVRLAAVLPDSIVFSFKVPPRLLESSIPLFNPNRAAISQPGVDYSQDGNGNLAMAAVATLIDFLGAAAAYRERVTSGNVSADMSISRILAAKLGDELEMTSRFLGRKGGYCGTHILIRNKTTGEIVAEGRHSLFDSATSFSKL